MNELHEILERQGKVARAYSPLCAAVLRAVSAEHAEGGAHAAEIEAYYARVVASTDLEKSLRVAAVLHHYVLREDPRVAALAPYYATVGGELDPDSDAFIAAARTALVTLGAEVYTRAIDWRVQTNETARGLAWLFVMSVLDVDAVHLVELGASAGLNMYAEQRGYRLVGEHGATELGLHPTPQFEIPAHGLQLPPNLKLGTPEVLSRDGGDKYPIDVADVEAMDTLRACIWGDQPRRFARLEEALSLHRDALSTDLGPVARVHRADLPEELESLLKRAFPSRPEAPVVIFNTYVTAYFSDVEHRELERRLRKHAQAHARLHRVPWVWIRFEPARRGETRGPKPAWCRWRVELFEGNEHRRIDLGWAHPHMAAIEFGDGLSDLLALRERNGAA